MGRNCRAVKRVVLDVDDGLHVEEKRKTSCRVVLRYPQKEIIYMITQSDLLSFLDLIFSSLSRISRSRCTAIASSFCALSCTYASCRRRIISSSSSWSCRANARLSTQAQYHRIYSRQQPTHLRFQSPQRHGAHPPPFAQQSHLQQGWTF